MIPTGQIADNAKGCEQVESDLCSYAFAASYAFALSASSARLMSRADDSVKVSNGFQHFVEWRRIDAVTFP
jgi:hypothetical protein